MSIANGRWVLTQEGCVHCKAFKEQHPDLGYKEQSLTDLSQKSPWWDVMDNLGIDGTPSVVEVSDGKACEIDLNNPEGPAGFKCTTIGKKSVGSMDEYIASKIS